MRTLLLLLAACSPDPSPGDGLAATRISPRDSAAQADTAGRDTARPDSADTAPVDTAQHTGDSGPADTSGDTSVDTAPVDTGLDPAAMAPDFALVDQNPNSPRVGEVVSPRDYLEQVSGWYFTHAT